MTKNNNIPHFCSVVNDVNEKEGVEITMNCNPDAFHWIIKVLRIKTSYDDLIEEQKGKNYLIGMATVR